MAGPIWRATSPLRTLYLLIAAVVMLVGAALFGLGWFAQADPFEVYSSLAARLAPVGRRGDGVLVWRNPFNRLDSLPPTPGMAAVVLVLLGSTAYDSLAGARSGCGCCRSARRRRWSARSGWRAPSGSSRSRTWRPPAPAVGWPKAVVGYRPGSPTRSCRSRSATWWPTTTAGRGRGQRSIILAADPLGTGTNLLGLSTTDFNTALVTATGVATLQVAAVVTGHIAGAVAAHDRAVRLFPPQLARWGQLPLLLLMVGYTYLGLTLLFAA